MEHAGEVLKRKNTPGLEDGVEAPPVFTGCKIGGASSSLKEKFRVAQYEDPEEIDGNMNNGRFTYENFASTASQDAGPNPTLVHYGPKPDVPLPSSAIGLACLPLLNTRTARTPPALREQKIVEAPGTVPLVGGHAYSVHHEHNENQNGDLMCNDEYYNEEEDSEGARSHCTCGKRVIDCPMHRMEAIYRRAMDSYEGNFWDKRKSKYEGF